MSLLKRLISRKAEPASPALPDHETLAAWIRTGYDQQVRGNAEEAQRLFRTVLEHAPHHPEALYFLGSVATEDGRDLEAIDYFERAADARPNDAALWYVLGGALFNVGRFDDSARAFQCAASLHPESLPLAGSYWTAMIEAGWDEEARVAIEQARNSGLDAPQIDASLAGIYRDHGRLEESLAAYRRLLARAPDDAFNYSNMLFTLNYSETHDAAALFAEHQSYAIRFARPYIAPPPDPAWPRKLRVGYVSPDFRAHVVAFFFEPILDHHDRARFEVFCYYTHRQDDHYTARLRAAADHWLDCAHLSDAELADRIRSDRIDILVDLAGHTGHNRIQVFAMKPAPVQVSYLGYPNTTGLAAIDYRITDGRADPPGDADRQSAERLVRLPDCFHCYRPREHSPAVGPLPAAATGHITFGCFNNFPKLSSGFLDAAARILAAAPNSRLWLKAKPLDTPYIAQRLRERFARAGIDPARVELTGWKSTHVDHMTAYGSVDLALDSFPYNGTTTTCEALWMGVPVVTLRGDRHAARVGDSLLHAVGLDELVAKDVDGFVAISTALAGDLGRLAELRSSLRERVRRSPLLDEAGFTSTLERHYLQMWESRIAGDAAAAKLDQGAIEKLLRRAAEDRKSRRWAAAGDAYKEILASRPEHLEALTAMWDLAFESGNPGASVDWLNKAIFARRDVAAFHYMLGCALQAQGKVNDAVASFSQALQIEPRLAKAHSNLGCSLEAAGDLAGALESYQRAVELDSKLAVAFYNQGNAYRQAGDFVQAIQCIRQALALEPAHADWRCNLGDLLYYGLQLDDAVSSYRGALELDPGFARAYLGLGLALQALGRCDEAEANLRKAVELDPASAEAHSSLLLSLHYLRAEDRQAVFDEHAAWARQHARGFAWQAARTDEERRLQGRLRIGYVSPDFQRNRVAHFIEPVLAAHDREKFHVFCYANVPHPDETTRRMQALCEDWRDISHLRDEQVTERMRFDGIDILVDLAGHTNGGRLALFARKPAPVQVSWLGYPDTTGLPAIDYRLTDERADPPGEADRFHTEKLMRLENGFLCYQPPSDCPQPAAPPSIEAGHVTFGSFNNLPKVTPAMVALWSRLLGKLPDSTLMLKAYGLSAESARRDLYARFAAHGVGAERLLILGPDDSAAGHLAGYNEIDVALDVSPYNGATTTCEALWMGAPVVTLAGKSHVSRVGMSILSRAGLADLVASSEDEYLEKALALASDVARRRELRASQRERLRGSPLLDAAGFARGLERAYLEMWTHYQSEEHAAVRLHIGGIQKMPGWKILNVQPGPSVDYVGDCTDLSQFADASVEEIYASHVLEHLGYQEQLPKALSEFHRVLKTGGRARISVPDFEVLCRLFLDPRHGVPDRIHIMRMAFGGQIDPHDFHQVGLSFDILGEFLKQAGFSRVERTGEFGLFNDTSSLRFSGTPISLNLVAYK